MDFQSTWWVVFSGDFSGKEQKMTFKDVLLPGSDTVMTLQPYLVMASRLNSTLARKTTEEYEKLHPFNNSAILLRRLARSASYDYVSVHCDTFFEGFDYDLLLHGTDIR